MLSLKHEAASDRSLPGLQQSVLGDRRLMTIKEVSMPVNEH